MGLLDGRKGVILNIANDRSIAWHIAARAAAEGATCGLGYLPGEKMERRVRKALEDGGLGDQWLHPCDVADDHQIERFFAAAEKHFGNLDFLVHSIAYADHKYLNPGRFTSTPRHVFAQALDISAYSLIALARSATPLMPRGGSILALTYLGSERVIPAYNIMGVAKAALEASARYLAYELGGRGIRVNTISAGPLRTLSAMAVGGIEEMFEHVKRKSPLGRNIEPQDIAGTAAYLLSDLSSGLTGENVHVDAGYNIVGV